MKRRHSRTKPFGVTASLFRAAFGLSLVTCAAIGCGAPGSSRDDGGPSDSDGSGGGGTPDDGPNPGSGGSVIVDDNGNELALLPARIRRLTNSEYNATVKVLLGTNEAPASDFPPDSRQHGFTVNEAQRVNPVLARALDAAARALAAEAKSKLDSFAPCSDPGGGAIACAESFIDAFGSKAYRRPLDADDRSALLALYQAGATDGTYADGIELVIRGVLQSPGFLYLTEIGDGTEDKFVEMTPYEIASALSYTITGGPPDEMLLAEAASGALSVPETREAEVRRLFTSEAGRARAVRIVREWLGVDRIEVTSKDANVYPAFSGARESMAKETENFVLAVLDTTPGTVRELLGSPWSVVDGTLASLYGVSGAGRVDTPNRIGLLNQGAFLSVYAHAHETAPVLRGVGVMRRVTCTDIELPTNLNLQIVPPVPDPSKTTRDRFAIHAADDGCASCHNLIDPVGFAFESFDGMGVYREMETFTNGSPALPVDSTAVVALGMDFDGPVSNSNDLASALASSEEVKKCFATQVFRSGAGEGQNSKAYETSFAKLLATLPADQQGSLLEILSTYAKSRLFDLRSPQ